MTITSRTKHMPFYGGFPRTSEALQIAQAVFPKTGSAFRLEYLRCDSADEHAQVLISSIR